MAKTSFDEVSKDTGEFKRSVSTFRNTISEEGEYKPEPNRYVLYISMACPWANRCYIVRNLKGLQQVIDIVVVEPKWGPVFHDNIDPPVYGWIFPQDEGSAFPRSTIDRYNNCKTLRELYLKACPDYQGKFTVPVLWDLHTNTIVNNESSEIIRLLNSAFNKFAVFPDRDFYPSEFRDEIDKWNEWMYNSINNGVYRCGFATQQGPYEQAFWELFNALDEAELVLQNKRFLCGNKLTESDIRLFVTLVRFDAVYYGHFKTNLKKIADYSALSEYVRDIYQIPEINETIDIQQIKQHYYGSHPKINPYLIVPVGPLLDFSAPDSRTLRFGESTPF